MSQYLTTWIAVTFVYIETALPTVQKKVIQINNVGVMSGRMATGMAAPNYLFSFVTELVICDLVI